MSITNLNEVIFIDSLPTLDLHGFDREMARVAIDDFIRDNLKMKQFIIVIIHGVGSGIIRNMTRETLKKNKNVLEHRIYPYNVGCTIVRLVDKS